MGDGRNVGREKWKKNRMKTENEKNWLKNGDYRLVVKSRCIFKGFTHKNANILKTEQ